MLRRLLPADRPSALHRLHQHAALRHHPGERSSSSCSGRRRRRGRRCSGGILHAGRSRSACQALGTVVVVATASGRRAIPRLRPHPDRPAAARRSPRIARWRRRSASASLALIAITFGVGTALAGIAGAILANQFFVSPDRRRAAQRVRLHRRGDRRLGQHCSARWSVRMMIALFQIVASAFVSYAVATGWPLCRVAGDASSCARKEFSVSVSSAASEPAALPRRWPAVLAVVAARHPPAIGAAAFWHSASMRWWASPYELRLLTIGGIYAIMVIGFQFIFGYAGAVSLAQSSFFGVGAYVTGVLATPLRLLRAGHLPAVDRLSGPACGDHRRPRAAARGSLFRAGHARRRTAGRAGRHRSGRT